MKRSVKTVERIRHEFTVDESIEALSKGGDVVPGEATKLIIIAPTGDIVCEVQKPWKVVLQTEYAPRDWNDKPRR